MGTSRKAGYLFTLASRRGERQPNFPYQLTGQELEARGSATTVEIFHRGVRVAGHPRRTVAYPASTTAEHRPKPHQRHLE